MSQRVEVPGRLVSGLSLDGLVQARPGYEEVEEVAVESVGSPPECLQLDGVVQFAALEVWNGLLDHSDAGCEFGAGHAEGVADRSDPTFVGAWLVSKRPKPLESGV